MKLPLNLSIKHAKEKWQLNRFCIATIIGTFSTILIKDFIIYCKIFTLIKHVSSWLITLKKCPTWWLESVHHIRTQQDSCGFPTLKPLTKIKWCKNSASSFVSLEWALALTAHHFYCISQFNSILSFSIQVTHETFIITFMCTMSSLWPRGSK
jgi:hypothetical protein